jgi:hypothetical protein
MSAIFTCPRKGLLGGRPMGADYMDDVEGRARRMRKACRPTPADELNQSMERQLFLPGLGTVDSQWRENG